MHATRKRIAFALISSGLVLGIAQGSDQPNAYADLLYRAPFEDTMRKMSAAKACVEAAHNKLLEARYDLSDKPSSTVKMSRGKPVQTGVRVKLKQGVTWDSLNAMSAEQIKQKDVYPAGFLPLPHPNHPEGGM